MKAAQQKPADDLRMSSKKFDKIMRAALQVQPQEAPKSKGSVKKAKPSAARKKGRAAK